MTSSLVLSAMLLTCGHVLPDDVVERAAQVTVYPNRLEIRYQIGFNETTMARQLERLDPDQPVSDDPDLNLQRYRQAILPHLAEQLEVRLDGQPREVLPVETRRIFLHHAQLEAVLEVPLEVSEEPVHLELHDRNYPDAPGTHRLAAKGRGGVRVLDSNVPPILARAAREDTTVMTVEELAERRHIDARFRVVDPDAVAEFRERSAQREAAAASEQAREEVEAEQPEASPPDDSPSRMEYRVAEGGVSAPTKDSNPPDHAPEENEAVNGGGFRLSPRGLILAVGVVALLAGLVLVLWQRTRREGPVRK